jgi:hypothetical protein
VRFWDGEVGPIRVRERKEVAMAEGAALAALLLALQVINRLIAVIDRIVE